MNKICYKLQLISFVYDKKLHAPLVNIYVNGNINLVSYTLCTTASFIRMLAAVLCNANAHVAPL